MSVSEGDRFAALTAAERQILTLLAAGHTAKTAAAALSLSVNGVNERLREARRKTGAGSSRDLARAVAAQENWDEKIGVASSTAASAEDEPNLPQPAVWKGTRPMVLGMGLAMTALLLGGIGWHQSRVEANDPLLGSLIADRGDDVATLYAKVRAEPRDDGWADRIEPLLTNRFVAVRGIASLRVRCAATLCEVAGRIMPGGASDIAVTDVQRVALTGLRDLGFADVASLAIGGKAEGGGAVFVAYPQRLPAGVPHVVATTPAMGETIAPGPFTLSVTFDRPMQPGSFSFVSSDRGAYPACDGKPRQSADGRSFMMPCTAVAGEAYSVGFNNARFRNFKSRDGVAAEPALLSFEAKR